MINYTLGEKNRFQFSAGLAASRPAPPRAWRFPRQLLPPRGWPAGLGGSEPSQDGCLGTKRRLGKDPRGSQLHSRAGEPAVGPTAPRVSGTVRTTQDKKTKGVPLLCHMKETTVKALKRVFKFQ